MRAKVAGEVAEVAGPHRFVAGYRETGVLVVLAMSKSGEEHIMTMRV